MNIYKKLMDARLKLQGTKLSKSGHNKFAGYQYFELGDFLPTVQTIFAEIGLCGVVSFSADIATLTVYETDGDSSIAFTSPMGSAALKGCHEVQNVGAVETYQRRYLWVTAMEIVEHDALDAITGDKSAEKVGNVTPIKATPLELKLNAAARNGTKALEALWKEISQDERKSMAGKLQGLKEAAAMQDAEIAVQA